MRDDGEPYEIGLLKGECALSFWVTVDGQRKRKHYRLGTSDESKPGNVLQRYMREPSGPKATP
jgi:hypothetical protein